MIQSARLRRPSALLLAADADLEPYMLLRVVRGAGQGLAYMLAQGVARPALAGGPLQPHRALAGLQRGHLRVMLETDLGVPLGHRKTPGDPGVIPQGLVVETCFRHRLPVSSRVLLLAIDEPVGEPPTGGVRYQEEVFAETLPFDEGEVGRKAQPRAAGER
jgi:hypothetical protein